MLQRIVLLLVLLSHLSLGQVPTDIKPSNDTGLKPFTPYATGDGNVNLTNGNLNFQIPIITLPGRNGLDLPIALVYDSKMWSPHPSYSSPTDVLYSWTIDQPTQFRIGDFGWHLNFPAITNGPWLADSNGNHIGNGDYIFTDWDGSKHALGRTGYYNFTDWSKDAEDGSGFTIDESTGSPIVYDKHGTAYFNTSRIEDANGNYIVAFTDTLGRKVSMVGTPTQTVSYLDSSGTTRTWTFHYTTITFLIGPKQQPSNKYFAYPVPFQCSSSGGKCINIYVVEPSSLPKTVLTSVTLPDNTNYTFSYNDYGELTEVTYPTGGYVKYEYGPYVHQETYWAYTIASCAVEGCAGTDIAGDFREVNKKRVCSANVGVNGTCATEDVTVYVPTTSANGASNVADDVYEGVPSSDSYMPPQTYQRRTSQGYTSCDQSDLNFSRYCTPKDAGKAIYDGNGTLLKATSINYSTYGNYPFLPTSITTSYDNGPVSTEQLTYDTLTAHVLQPLGVDFSLQTLQDVIMQIDNVTERKVFDYGQTTTPLRREVNTYVKYSQGAYDPPHILDRKQEQQIYDGANNLLADTKWEYDSPLDGVVASGAVNHDVPAVPRNVSAIKRWRNTDNTWLATYYRKYDDAGNVLLVQDPKGNQTQLFYDDSWGNSTCAPTSAKAYLTKVIKASGMTTAGTYNSCTGKVASIVDPNSQTTSYSYDLFGRLLTAVAPLNASTSFTYPNPNTVNRAQSITSAISLNHTITFDGRGRIIQTALTSDPDGPTYTDTAYDALGRIQTVSNQYRSGDTKYYTTTAYDALDRGTQTAGPDGTAPTSGTCLPKNTCTSYAANTTTVTDQAGNQLRSFADALGRVIEVDEPTPPGAPAAAGSGTVAINCAIAGCTDRSTQTGGQPAVAATGSFAITGTEQVSGDGTYDTGTVKLTIGASSFSVSYGQGSTASSIASALSCEINAATSAPATAPCPLSGNIVVTARTPGSAGNSITLGYTVTYDRGNFSSASFAVGQSGATLIGGQDAVPPTTVYDSGTVSITVNAETHTVSYGSSSTAASVASALTSAFSQSTLVTVSTSGTAITLTSRATGAASNYPLSVSSVTNSSSFTGTSFPVAASASTFTGGSDGNPGGLATPYITLYQYDALGNLTCVEEHGEVAGTGCSSAPSSDATSPWRVRRFTYNSLSQLLTATNPESGQISYTYDANGNVLTKTAPAPNQLTTGTATASTTFTYDSLNRLTKKTYTDTYNASVTPIVIFAYDGQAATGCSPPALTDLYPVGRRTAMCDGSGATSWVHDQLGRITQERRKIGTTGGLFTRYSYNRDDSLASLTDASAKTIAYATGGAGRPLSATNAAPIKYVTNAKYAPFGGLTSMLMGSATGFTGITVTNAYNMRLQPILLSATSPSATLLSLCYDFHLGVAITAPSPCSFSASTLGDNGNIWQIINNRDGNRTQNFDYDSLNRITQGYSNGANWGETFTIDPWGNLTNKAGYGTKINYESLNAPALLNNRLTGFGYDPAGNMISNGSATYTYDDENRLTAAGGVFYTYDGDGNRARKCSTNPCTGTSTGTLYWRNLSGETLAESDLAGNMAAEYVYFDGKRVARRDVSNSVVHYYFSDHLGSASVVTNATGTTPFDEDLDYYPYGGIVATSSDPVPQHYKFTGKERDSESGLDMFGARYYGSSLGRFMTPDWAAKPIDVPYADFGNPQSLNLYSYVRNNPTTTRDPDGHCIEDACVIEGLLIEGGIAAWHYFAGAAVLTMTASIASGGGNISSEYYHAKFANASASSLFFSKDAEAGQLQASGRDAIDKANATIERASQDIASFKNPADVKNHIDELTKGVDRVKDLSTQLDKTKGKAERDKIKTELQKEIDQVKGHEKDLRQKPKVPKKDQNQGN